MTPCCIADRPAAAAAPQVRHLQAQHTQHRGQAGRAQRPAVIGRQQHKLSSVVGPAAGSGRALPVPAGEFPATANSRASQQPCSSVRSQSRPAAATARTMSVRSDWSLHPRPAPHGTSGMRSDEAHPSLSICGLLEPVCIVAVRRPCEAALREVQANYPYCIKPIVRVCNASCCSAPVARHDGRTRSSACCEAVLRAILVFRTGTLQEERGRFCFSFCLSFRDTVYTGHGAVKSSSGKNSL